MTNYTTKSVSTNRRLPPHQEAIIKELIARAIGWEKIFLNQLLNQSGISVYQKRKLAKIQAKYGFLELNLGGENA